MKPMKPCHSDFFFFFHLLAGCKRTNRQLPVPWRFQRHKMEGIWSMSTWREAQSENWRVISSALALPTWTPGTQCRLRAKGKTGLIFPKTTFPPSILFPTVHISPEAPFDTCEFLCFVGLVIGVEKTGPMLLLDPSQGLAECSTHCRYSTHAWLPTSSSFETGSHVLHS